MESIPSSPSRSSGFVTPPLSPPAAPEDAVEVATPEVAPVEEVAQEDVVEIGIGDLTIDDPAPPSPGGALSPDSAPLPEEVVDTPPPVAPGGSGQDPTSSAARVQPRAPSKKSSRNTYTSEPQQDLRVTDSRV